jgi:hypothetical protein
MSTRVVLLPLSTKQKTLGQKWELPVSDRTATDVTTVTIAIGSSQVLLRP